MEASVIRSPTDSRAQCLEGFPPPNPGQTQPGSDANAGQLVDSALLFLLEFTRSLEAKFLHADYKRPSSEPAAPAHHPTLVHTQSIHLDPFWREIPPKRPRMIQSLPEGTHTGLGAASPCLPVPKLPLEAKCLLATLHPLGALEGCELTMATTTKGMFQNAEPSCYV